MQNFITSSVLMLALSASASTLSHSQTIQTPDQTPTTPVAAPKHANNPTHETRELTKKLGLSAAQRSQIEPILADRDQKIQALASGRTLGKKAMHQQRHAIMTDFESKMDAVLTDPQKQQLAALKAKHQQHGAKAPAPAAPPAI